MEIDVAASEISPQCSFFTVYFYRAGVFLPPTAYLSVISVYPCTSSHITFQQSWS